MADAIRSPDTPRSAIWRAFAPSWPMLVASAVFIKSIAGRSALLNDPDTYLHIAVGRWMLLHHALPRHDPFSNSVPGAPWVVHEWLSELVLAVAYEGLGWWGVILLVASAFALTLALLTRWLLKRIEPMAALALVLLSAMMLIPHLLARPHWLAAPLLLAWCAGVVGARDAGRAPPLALLPLMTLWANLHGGYVVGIAVAVFFGAEAVLEAPRGRRWRAARDWSGFALLAIAAASLTPNGLGTLTLPFHLVGMSTMHAYIQEWRALDFGEFRTYEIWIITLIGAGLGLGLTLPLPRLFLIVVLTHLGLAHSRYIDVAAVLGPLALAAPLGPQLEARFATTPASALRRWFCRLAEPAGRGSAAVTAAALLAITLTCISHPFVREDRAETPAAAIAVAERLQLKGPVFNSYAFGGFLIFRGIAPFIDGRLEVYGDAFLRDFVTALSGDSAALADILDHYRIGWTLLRPDDGAAGVLERMPGWQRVYADQHAVIHVRVASPGS